MIILKRMFQVAVLFVFAFIGNWLQGLFQLPIPGSILGLLLLLAALALNIVKVEWIKEGAGFLLATLPLILVPATVGIMNYPSLFSGKGIFIFGIVILSTMITIIATGKTSQILEERAHKRKEKKMWVKHLSR